MAISASSIASSSTLNELRTQFNNLVTDVTAIEGGSISYTTLNTTNLNSTTLNVKEDGTIIFEGATDDGFETTLTVVDPTADRTITFPNETGTVHTTGGDTTHTNIIIADGANIGSASDTNAMSISSGGVISVTATTANTSATDGALTVAGGLGVAADVSIGDDLRLISDGAVLNFGADSDVTLTHVADTGILLNGTSVIQFNDASQSIGAPSNAILDINATDEIELNATLLDVNANINASGTYTGAGLMTTGGNIVIPDAGTIGSASDTNAIGISSGGVVSVTATTANTSASDGALTVAGGLGVAADVSIGDDLRLISDSSVLSFGADSDTTLTHTDGSGLTLNSTNKLMFNDASQFIQGASATVLDIAATDEIELTATLIDVVGNAAVSGTLNVTGVTTSNAGIVVDEMTIDADSITATDAFNIDAAANIVLDAGGANVILHDDSTEFGRFQQISSNFVIHSAISDKDMIFSGNDGGASITALTLDMSAAGAATFNNNVTVGDDLKLITDASVLSFGVNSEIALTHVHDTGLLLTDSGGTPTLQFHDANESFSSDGSKIIMISGGTTFNMPTSDGTDGQALATDGSGTLSFVSVAANTPSSADGQALGSASLEWSDLFLADAGTIQFGNDQEIRLTHVADVGLTLSHTASGDDKPVVLNLKSEEDELASGEEIGRIDFTAGDSGGTDAITTAASIAAVAEDAFASDNNSTGLAFKLGVSAAATEMFRMNHDGDFKVLTDGSAIAFGANNEIELTHVHNTGLLLTDSGGSPTLQLHDSNESVMSDGTNLKLTSGGTAYTIPTSDGSNGQFLKTNGSGVLSFGTVTTTGVFAVYEYTATAAQTSFSGNDDNSSSLSYTAGVNNVLVSVNGVLLDGSDYTATNGTAVVLSVAAAANDMIKIQAANSSSITSTDLNGSELVLDADGDTTLAADTDDTIDIKIAGADDFRFTANKFEALSGSSIDMNGGEIILDADADTSITADTDDQIDIRIGGADDFKFTANSFNVLSGSTLTVDSGATITNSGTANGFGKILQVVSTTKTDVFSSSTVNQFVDITGLSVAITPRATSSKILVLYDTQMSGTELFFIQLVRASTAIKVGDSDSANRKEVTVGGVFQSSNNDKVAPIAGNFLDSPSTTSAVTYKLQGQVYDSGNSFKVNASVNDANAAYAGRGASTITVMEVEG